MHRLAVLGSLLGAIVLSVVLVIGHGGGASSAAAVRLVADTGADPAPVPAPASLTHSKGLSASALARQEAVAACAQVKVRQEIVVDIGLQHLWTCDRTRVVLSTPVTTGATARGDATPTGTWKIEAKERDRFLSGPGYNDYVHYWMPFYGNYGLHDAPWQTMRYGSPQYPTRGSHGCVHVDTPVMAKVYQWAQIGTTVHIEE
ncbi:MAG TPA: L,D-transpeptidase [Acidimicrobiales bacterium]|nr:L,D-transpeptidase [Acidimicrobiales bacterium]